LLTTDIVVLLVIFANSRFVSAVNGHAVYRTEKITFGNCVCQLEYTFPFLFLTNEPFPVTIWYILNSIFFCLKATGGNCRGRGLP
jgi:hypothetical protein